MFIQIPYVGHGTDSVVKQINFSLRGNCSTSYTDLYISENVLYAKFFPT